MALPERAPRPAGVKVLFRVGLTLVRLALGTTEQRLACPGLLETLGALRAIPPTQLQEEVFMSQVGAPTPATLPSQWPSPCCSGGETELSSQKSE